MADIRSVLLDVEGTTTPIAFVRDTLFPFARAHLPGFLRDHAADPAVAAELATVPGLDRLATLLGWMDADEKYPALKTLQGLIWDAGYADGRLKGEIYPDVAPCLRHWRASGRTLAVYSSGSVSAQQLIFRHSTAGDLSALFAAHFDTRTGPKRDPASYAAIAAHLGTKPLFLSDLEAELDAAATAGLPTCQIVRAADRTVASTRHLSAADFPGVEAIFQLT